MLETHTFIPFGPCAPVAPTGPGGPYIKVHSYNRSVYVVVNIALHVIYPSYLITTLNPCTHSNTFGSFVSFYP